MPYSYRSKFAGNLRMQFQYSRSAQFTRTCSTKIPFYSNRTKYNTMNDISRIDSGGMRLIVLQHLLPSGEPLPLNTSWRNATHRLTTLITIWRAQLLSTSHAQYSAAKYHKVRLRCTGSSYSSSNQPNI